MRSDSGYEKAGLEYIGVSCGYSISLIDREQHIAGKSCILLRFLY